MLFVCGCCCGRDERITCVVVVVVVCSVCVCCCPGLWSCVKIACVLCVCAFLCVAGCAVCADKNILIFYFSARHNTSLALTVSGASGTSRKRVLSVSIRNGVRLATIGV